MIRKRSTQLEQDANAVDLQRGRSAFTLLELLIVVSVIAVIAGLSWPRLTRFLRQQQIEGNAEQVRQVLDRARIEAVEEGRILQVRFEPEGRKYVLLPYDPVDQSQTVQSQGVVSTSFTDPSGSRTTEGQTKETYQVYEMTEGCRFYIERADPGETSNFSRLGEEWLGHLENGFSARDTVWTAPILYYPDGSATDGIVTVVDEQNRFIELFVRGLTGAVRSTKVAIMEGRNATSN